MFGWLAKMLLQTPVSSSGCACCEAKREHLEKMRKEITRQLKDEILVTPKVKLVKKDTLPQSEGKAVRVRDLRNNR